MRRAFEDLLFTIDYCRFGVVLGALGVRHAHDGGGIGSVVMAMGPELVSFIGKEMRFVDGDCDGVETVDIGAYEFEHKQIGDLNGDCAVEWGDLLMLADYWLSGEASAEIDASDGRGIVNIDDLGVLAGYWLN